MIAYKHNLTENGEPKSYSFVGKKVLHPLIQKEENLVNFPENEKNLLS